MRRLPIRLRLTLAFGIAIALVLAATGFFLYARLRSNLDAAIDDGLRAGPRRSRRSSAGPARRSTTRARR